MSEALETSRLQALGAAAAIMPWPLLRAAVRAGEVSVRAAEAVLPKAVGDEEAKWVERARVGTVRGLKAAAKQGAGALEA